MTALIGTSVLLIAASAIMLVLGWTAADESLIWTSIVASAAAGVTLSLAYFRSRQETSRVPRGEAPAPTAAPEGSAGDEVVIAPSTKRFHRPECRYASTTGERMTATAARHEGYTPCGICKP